MAPEGLAIMAVESLKQALPLPAQFFAEAKSRDTEWASQAEEGGLVVESRSQSPAFAPEQDGTA
jgi:acetylornithine deacetylase